MKAMESINDLIEEAKLRTVWWALCIFSVTYFLSHTSSSMWINLPIAIMFVSALRILLNEVEFGWKSQRVVHRPSYLSHLRKKQLSLNDWRLSFALPPPKWKREIDSPVVEAAATEFIDKIIKDFVVDLWYSAITPDKESPELMHAVIMDAIGEISGRVKEINLVDLLTRDVVDLIGDHLDLFRRNLASIGADVMATLSTEERDERLKHHLMDSKELHPALVSPESEYKVLQRLIGGVLALVLRPREAQSPLVRAIARELVTCLVMQPVMNLASPEYINQLIECILLAIGGDGPKDIDVDKSVGGMPNGDSIPSKDSSSNSSRTDNFDNLKDNQGTDMTLAKTNNHRDTAVSLYQQEPTQPHHADWARMLEAATQRRTEVLAPENLENMWTKGRNYKRKENKKAKPPVANSSSHTTTLGKEILPSSTGTSTVMGVKATVQVAPQLSVGNLVSSENKNVVRFIQQEYNEALSSKGAYVGDELENRSNLTSNENKGRLKRSNSTSALKLLTDRKMAFSGDDEGPIISEFYSPDFKRHSEYHVANKSSDLVLRKEGPFTPKLKCRVVGAYFEKIGSKSFAVYSIAVTDTENRTSFVKRRYRNFERLHRQLKEIPNYTLHLPPKRIFSSSTEDAFVHQRCIQLDKYLQDLLSIANVAEQHEVWDFLSVSSKNYSFGKSPSVMRTLAVNVDDAMDDIVRQFKGVSDGLMRKVVGSSSLDESSFSVYSGNLSWHVGDMDKSISRQDTLETLNSFSDNEENHNHEHHDQVEVSSAPASGSHSDNELNSKAVPPWDIKHNEESADRTLEKKHNLEGNSEQINQGSFAASKTTVAFNTLEDPYGMPPEWSPSNVSVPLLNLVDNVFQLKRRGWLRRQVFWISKQILQLIMEDAIDEWLLRQIYLLRREDTIAEGIRWLHNFLWPGGTFFTRVGVAQRQDDNTVLDLNRFQLGQFSGSNISKKGSFEEQLESTRRASDIKKMLFDGAPSTLVSLIGSKQYKRCARDIFYFTQSTICMKQLAYGALELVLLSVFPELRDLVVDLNEKMRVPPA